MSTIQNFIHARRGPLLVMGFFGLVSFSLLRKIFDPDIWFHMVVGREVIRQMQVPGVEFYILPMLGEPGEFHEWGFGVFYCLINQYSGYVGMAFVNAAIGCGILLFLYKAAHGGAQSEWWQSLPVIALVLWVIEPRINFRPETFLYLLLAVEIFLLENYLEYRKQSWLIPLPFLAWLLSQVHPSAIFLIGVFGMYSLQAILSTTANKFKSAIELGVVALAMSVGAVLNPYGLRQLLLPFYFQNDALISSLTEFLPVLQTEYAPHFIAIAAIGLIAILFGPKKRWVDFMLACSFAILALKYARNTALLGIVMFVPIRNGLEYWLGKTSGLVTRRLVMLCSIVAGIAGIVATGIEPSWGIGIWEENTPYKSAVLIRRHSVQGNILNFFHLGNYLAWNLDRPVFVDGRNYENNRAVQLHDAVFRADQGWQEIIYRFNIQAIVTPATLDYSGEIIPLVAALENDPDWVLVGQEKAGLLFLKNPVQEGVRVLPKNIIWRQAIEELNNTMALNPDSKETYRSLATAYGHLGDVSKQAVFSGKFSALSN
jgi:hypothetical protein